MDPNLCTFAKRDLRSVFYCYNSVSRALIHDLLALCSPEVCPQFLYPRIAGKAIRLEAIATRLEAINSNQWRVANGRLPIPGIVGFSKHKNMWTPTKRVLHSILKPPEVVRFAGQHYNYNKIQQSLTCGSM